MGVHNADHPVKGKARIVVNVPAVAGDYASERITFGSVSAGDIEQSYMGASVLVEGTLAGATIELWLPQVSDGTLAASNRTDANYFFSGSAIGAPLTGAGTWPLAGWPGLQFRVKSGGTPGAIGINATAF